jgi:hypothetical protein
MTLFLLLLAARERTETGPRAASRNRLENSLATRGSDFSSVPTSPAAVINAKTFTPLQAAISLIIA